MAATLVRLAADARVWHVTGIAATVTAHTEAATWARIDGERTPVRIDGCGWALALACDNCDRPAQVQLCCGRADDVLCPACAGARHRHTASWVRPIPPALIRALHGQCEQLT